ncbi:MAG: forespore capture DNA-binding protein RefZ [Sporolactobacillus sp.]
MQMKKAVTSHDASTKEAVLHAALKLFNMSGYDGTPVRAIAQAAGVNVALISYYFGGKQGLLEYLMSSFYEGYLKELNRATLENLESGLTAAEQLARVAETMIAYQQQHFYLSRFAHREMTLDTQLVRELMASYLMKEKSILLHFIQVVLPETAADPMSADFTVLHYREWILMPFQQPQFLREVFFLQPSEPSFRNIYMRFIRRWAKQLTDMKGSPAVTYS